MIPWLFDTLVATGVLMAIILLLRRPVARAFGPGVAYALWALPLIRLILPPLILPARFAPQTDLPDRVQALAVGAPLAIADAAPSAAAWNLAYWSIVVWLCGAASFLIWRTWSYAAMRRHLLKGARPMGEADGIRIVETRAAKAPIAFGVLDKVIALPWGFMASPDRQSRDFALEHEFQHHAGRDLAANLVFQPLLALHWFNPVGWYAWRAMRRDQEAACDARVMAGRESSARQAYGRLIASYAAGSRLALVAAPMACPVLGEKSIIQRLKHLARPEVSGRRRVAGGALLVASALALPVTATISYAEVEFHPLARTVAAPVAATEVGMHWASADEANRAEPAAQAQWIEELNRADGAENALPSPQSVGVPGINAEDYPTIPRVPAAPGHVHEQSWPPLPPLPPHAPLPPAPPALLGFAGNVPISGHDHVHQGDADDDCGAEADRMVDQSIARKDAQRARVRFAECTRRVANAHVVESLKDARLAVEGDTSLLESVRRDVLANFDRQIARLSSSN